MQPIQLLAPDGTYTEHDVYSEYIAALGEQDLRDLYRLMATERRMDAEATSLQRQGQLALWVPALGQEAAQAGTVSALKPTDMIFPTYREHVMALHRGIRPDQIIQLFRATAHSGWDPREHAMNVYMVVLGAQTLHAAGWAMGIQRELEAGDLADGRAEDEIVLACLGDGASSQGDVHESMVFASSYELPVLYFIQNNHWAISVPSSTQSRSPLAARAAGYGFEGVQVDGNDVLASYAVAAHMAGQVRAGGPKLIESVTYRMGAHTTADDPTKYRSADEVEAWRAKDPLDRYRRWLEAEDLADDIYFSEVDQEAAEVAAELRRAVQEIDPLPLEEAMDAVYAEPHRQVETDKAWLKEYEAGFVDDDALAGGEAGAR
ncbi:MULTISPECIES: thiamine pyrophosphate-dependent enzyme [unclassified Nesterenkonia]|uniref:thiamine pyrophosphate-dependent enzyme n=1 Tax=unclassified Nesterenkonia TaxID=2629769 RepID=UPI000871EB0D|nr:MULTISPECIES: thiamine pyrophosphate-dependent enzyme [unclassified Nesterenkonia]MDS2173058.1 thiamine pyrophosphate-dependent enzyme [Nesterenkonia sp. CL21]OSM43414.1 pyruvate dehydrogenase (acetyl-transferring) E1 component subunit alpha [Nesterenkonia sp. PF2B19]